MIDREKFFSGFRARFGKLTKKQVEGFESFLSPVERTDLPLRQLAYLFATAYHETAFTMLPIEEYGKGRGKKYGQAVNGKKYYGRGYVQLTWDYNYEKATTELRKQCPVIVAEFERKNGRLDLVEFPEQALVPEIAFNIMVLGSSQGWFTGKKLSDYINGNKCDYINARRIINGTDRAKLIAGNAQKFKEILSESVATKPEPQPEPAAPAPAVQEAPVQDPSSAKVSLFTKIGTAVTGITALGLNVGAVVETKLKEMTPAQVGYLCVTLALAALAIWWYRRSSDNAHRERMKGDAQP